VRRGGRVYHDPNCKFGRECICKVVRIGEVVTQEAEADFDNVIIDDQTFTTPAELLAYLQDLEGRE